MATQGPFLPVVAPAMPAPPQSLLTIASEVQRAEEDRWTAGFTYQPEACFAGEVLEVCPPSPVTKQLEQQGDPRAVFPVALKASDHCSTFGHAAQDFQARAQRLLLRSEHKLAEGEFWVGQINGWAAAARGAQPFTIPLSNGHFTSPGYNPTLASPNAFILNGNIGPSLGTTLVQTAANLLVNIPAAEGAVLTAQAGLAALEAGLADCGSGAPGFIHATHDVVSVWHGMDLIVRENGQLVTGLGNIVVPGPGYTGTAPGVTVQEVAAGFRAPPAGTAWVYATSPVSYRRDAVVNIGEPGTQGTPGGCLGFAAPPLTVNVPVDVTIDNTAGPGTDYAWTIIDQTATDQLASLISCLNVGGNDVLVLTFDFGGTLYEFEIPEYALNALSPPGYVAPDTLDFTASANLAIPNPGNCGDLIPGMQAPMDAFVGSFETAPASLIGNTTGRLISATCATQGADQRDNTVTTIAERLYATYFDECCHLAVLLDACAPVT